MKPTESLSSTKRIVITGGAGQAGLGVAEAARNSGWEVVLLGRRRPEELPLPVQESISRMKAEYRTCSTESPELLPHVMNADCWIQAAEPFHFRPGESEVQWTQAADHIYETAVSAGYAGGGKRMIRIGSPPAETWETSRWEKQTSRSAKYPEDEPLRWSRADAACMKTSYFRAKRIYRSRADHFVREKGLDIQSVCPGALTGPYGVHGDREWLKKAAALDFPFRIFIPSDPGNAVPLHVFAEAVLFTLKAGKPGEVWHVPGWNVGGREFFDRIATLAGHSPGLRLSFRMPSPAVVSGLSQIFHFFTRQSPPWFLDPDVYALMRMTGNRSADKIRERGFQVDAGEAEVCRAVQQALEWYRRLEDQES